MSMGQQPRRRLNMQQCGLNIYAAQSHTKNARTMPLIVILKTSVIGCAARSCQTRRCDRPRPIAALHRGAREPVAAA